MQSLPPSLKCIALLALFASSSDAAPAYNNGDIYIDTNVDNDTNATDYEHVIDVDFLLYAETVGVQEYHLKQGFQWVQGDMIVKTSTLDGVLDRNAAADALLWPNAVVPYTLHASLGNDMRGKIQEAIADFNRFTCVRFVPHTTQPAYVDFTSERAGCFAYLGMSGGRQGINLQDPGCRYKGTVIHEMLHSLGFAHEQSRRDRDQFVTINWHNIQSSHHSQFKQLDVGNERNLATAYDYGSVMHYPSKGFSMNGQPTITTKDPSKQSLIGQRLGFSQTDVHEVKQLYKCRADGTSGLGDDVEYNKCNDYGMIYGTGSFWFNAPKKACMKGFKNLSGRDLRVSCEVRDVPNCNGEPFILIYIPGKPHIKHYCKPASGKIEETVPSNASQFLMVFGSHGVAIKGDFTCRVSPK